jgi:CRISPR-associated protein Cas2
MRRRFCITYDIADDKRRSKVAKLLEGEGDRVQFSVFLCDLDKRELIKLKACLDPILHHRDDQVLFLDLGPADTLPETILATMGRTYTPPEVVLVV